MKMISVNRQKHITSHKIAYSTFSEEMTQSYELVWMRDYVTDEFSSKNDTVRSYGIE